MNMRYHQEVVYNKNENLEKRIINIECLNTNAFLDERKANS